MLLVDGPDPVEPPKAWQAPWLLFLFWVFMFSFAFDFKAEEPTTFLKLLQFGFLGIAALSSALMMILGAPFLSVRPGGWLLAIWGLFLSFMMGNALLQGVEPGRFIRTGMPFFLSFAAMLNSHVAAASGIRVSSLATPIFLVAVINIIWRIIFGLAFTSSTLDTARAEILSPALSWAAAFIGCSILLRKRFHWTMLLAASAFFTAMLLSITRSLLFPVAASAVATSVFFALGFKWGTFSIEDLFKRLLPISLVATAVLFFVGLIFVLFPSTLIRWEERLFSPTSDRNMASDPSLLTRQAEAKAIHDILNEDPVRYINGMGVGASFYWDHDFFPELYQVYEPDDLEEISTDIWYAGHSIWTYSLFSGGIIALTAFISLFVTSIAYSIASAAANAQLPGPDYWLLFLPAITALCILSESATSNPFDERLLGMIFGATFSFSQAGFLRAHQLRLRSRSATRPANPIL